MTANTTWKFSENKQVLVNETTSYILGGVNYLNGWYCPWAMLNDRRVELAHAPTDNIAKRTVENYIINIQQLDDNV
ncbi:hypothetical protein [Runella limosa]|uniref:hypothetical protein n=1 Tax=Runella limosa TaxID=370978 RepID=UPI00049091FA|nr:hypothetical protein [Runella limosa]